MPMRDGPGYWPAEDGLTPEILSFLSPRETPAIVDAVVAGAKAGALGSVIAAVFLVFTYSRHGGEALLPARIMALQLSGDAGFASSALGVLMSAIACLVGGAAFGAAFGVLMARLVGRLGLLAVVGVGTIYGVLVWIVTQFVVVAYLAPQALLLYDQHTLAVSFGVYGACLGLLGRAYRSHSLLA